MSDRQGSTGALARRVSDYEMVRDFFASTTVVLAVDLTFMILFLAFITLVGGWLVFVPLAGIAVMLTAGLSLQRQMGRVALDAQADSSLQHSVLVESISGAETLKAARAEGQMLGRWRRYASMSRRDERADAQAFRGRASTSPASRSNRSASGCSSAASTASRRATCRWARSSRSS